MISFASYFIFYSHSKRIITKYLNVKISHCVCSFAGLRFHYFITTGSGKEKEKKKAYAMPEMCFFSSREFHLFYNTSTSNETETLVLRQRHSYCWLFCFAGCLTLWSQTVTLTQFLSLLSRSSSVQLRFTPSCVLSGTRSNGYKVFSLHMHSVRRQRGKNQVTLSHSLHPSLHSLQSWKQESGEEL